MFKILYYLTLFICSIGCILIIDKQSLTVSFVISAIIVYLWQISMYSKIRALKDNKTTITFDAILCLILDISIILVALYFHYFNLKFLLLGFLLFILILISNHFILKFWNSIEIEK